MIFTNNLKLNDSIPTKRNLVDVQQMGYAESFLSHKIRTLWKKTWGKVRWDWICQGAYFFLTQEKPLESRQFVFAFLNK